MKSIRDYENGAIIGATEEFEKEINVLSKRKPNDKICGNCKSYFRCEMFIAEDSDFAERCALFRKKYEK